MEKCFFNADTRNRFEPDNRFIGDIEDGKRYPYGTYTKCETDALLEAKADKATVEALAAEVATKASAEAVEGLQPMLSEDNKLNPEYIEGWEEKASVHVDSTTETLIIF